MNRYSVKLLDKNLQNRIFEKIKIKYQYVLMVFISQNSSGVIVH
jgi:hypothetical protein